MAEKDKGKTAEVEGEAPAKPNKGKRKLILFAGIGVLVVVLAAGAAFFLFGGKSGEAAGEDTALEEDAKEANHDQPPVYLKLDAFTTNLAIEDPVAGTAGQYIQVVIELKVEDAASGEALNQYMPEIRNNILRLLSARRASQLASTEGKDLLASEIRDGVNGILSPGSQKTGKAPRGPVQSVLFSSFIIQ